MISPKVITVSVLRLNRCQSKRNSWYTVSYIPLGRYPLPPYLFQSHPFSFSLCKLDIRIMIYVYILYIQHIYFRRLRSFQTHTRKCTYPCLINVNKHIKLHIERTKQKYINIIWTWHTYRKIYYQFFSMEIKKTARINIFV